jgi:hypothetical protein
MRGFSRTRPRVIAAKLAAVLAGAAAAFTGCSALDPFPTYPQQPASGVKDAGPRVAICYDLLKSSREAVEQAAQAECGPNSRPDRVDTDWKLDYCPLLLPARATFVCKPAKKAEIEPERRAGSGLD